MSRRHLLFFFVILALLLTGYFVHKGSIRDQVSAGQIAPPVTLKDEQGKKISLADYRGRVVLLHFWATWCGPCAFEIPRLDKLVKKLSPEKFVLLAVSMDDQGPPAIRKFKKLIPFDFPVLFDPDYKVSDAYGTFRLPESYLIDPKGMVVKKFSGAQEWDSPEWERKIRNLMVP